MLESGLFCAARKFQVGHDLSRTKQSATVGLMRIADQTPAG
jgi:hypothetical protein